ncbi:MAG: molecular chaperone DnaJ [Pyramidobacter sp.]|nr:molecular chaperone DnaJ [Pyramidobacter sp.]
MAENRRDFYEVLEVSRTATAEEIKKAYRQKVRTCHPDSHPDDPDAERKFKEVNEAYSVLSDSEKRSRYDQFGTADENAMPFGGAEDVFGDLFGSFFGGGFGGARPRPDAPRRGSDLEMVLSVTLEEAARGVARKITIPRWEPCDHCGGTGAEPGYEPRTCSTCGGTGQVRSRVRTIFGDTVTVGTCPTCGGRGKVVEKPCSECGGEGRVHRRREQEIKVQAGVDRGTRLRVAGAGELGVNGGAPGDLYIVMDVKEHPDFERDGLDLHCAVTIPYPLAVLGGTSSVETLIDGTAEYAIPEGTAPGQTIRLKGKGMPRLRGSGRGDLYLHVTISVPKGSSLSEKELELTRQLAQEMDVSASKGDEPGFFDKLFGGKKDSSSESKKKASKKKK